MSTTYYLVATRDIAGKLNPDWDGELHDTIEDGQRELKAALDGEYPQFSHPTAVLLRCTAVDA